MQVTKSGQTKLGFRGGSPTVREGVVAAVHALPHGRATATWTRDCTNLTLSNLFSPSGKDFHMNNFFCGLLLSLFVAVGANAQTVEGVWKGALKANDVELRVRLHVTEDKTGALEATFDSIDQDAMGLPISSISLKDSTLKFELEEASASYEGKINGDRTRVSGTWTQGGVSLPLEFTRITVRREETKKKTPRPSDIDGDWEGGPSNLRFVLHIITYDDGITAEVDSPDQNAFGIPVTTITRDGAELKFEIKSIEGSYEGKINPELTTISGTWYQWNARDHLVLKRKNAVPQRADAVTGDPENLKRFVGAWKQEPSPDPIHDVAQAVIFKIEGGKLICTERQLSYRYVNGEFFRDRDEFTPTGELKVKGKTVSWRTRRLKYLGEGVDIQTRVTLTSDNEAVLDYIGEIKEGDQPMMLAPYRLTLKKQP